MMQECDSMDELDLVDFGDFEGCLQEPVMETERENKDDLFLRAVRMNDVAMTEKMLNEGISVNMVYRSGWNSLMHACEFGSVDVVELLLNYGADATTQINTFSALMAVCSSQCNSEDCLLSCAKRLIAGGAIVNAFDRHQMTPLMYACQHNRASVAQLLLANGADAYIKDIRGWTAFIYAASNGNKTLMKCLLASGCDQRHTYAEELGVVQFQQSGKEEYETEDQQYIDLEVFLLGIQCQDCLPIFKKHQVTLEILLTMTEQDLERIGILKVALQKRILTTVASIHRKEWDMPQMKLQVVLSSSEAVMTMLHVKKHIQYLQATCHILIKSTNHTKYATNWRMDNGCAQELICEAGDLNTTVTEFKKQVSQLKNEVKCVEAHKCNTKRHTVAICCVTCFLCCAFYMWWKS